MLAKLLCVLLCVLGVPVDVLDVLTLPAISLVPHMGEVWVDVTIGVLVCFLGVLVRALGVPVGVLLILTLPAISLVPHCSRLSALSGRVSRT